MELTVADTQMDAAQSMQRAELAEVLKGFKQTEVGIIPQDWEVKTVRELIDLLTDYDANGSFASVAEGVTVYDSENYAWYVRSTDLENDTRLSEVRYVDEESYKFLEKTSLYGGELLFLKRGDIGKVYLFKMKTAHATVAPNLYLLKINKFTFPEYLYHYFNTNLGQSQLKSKNASSTLGALYKDDVKAIKVPLPPTLREQKAIAEALSDMDAMIRSLERLVEKKKAIKQGAMQELLKPKEGWVERSIGDHGHCLRGVSYNPRTDLYASENENSFTLLRSNNIFEGQINFIDVQHVRRDRVSSEQEIQKGDILICTANGSKKLVGKSGVFRRETKSRLTFGAFMGVFRTAPEHHFGFISLVFHSENYRNQIELLLAGSSINNLKPSDIESITFRAPSFDDQKEIYEIIESMELETRLLKSKLTKTRQLKQGMMQDLLTGKKRLV